MNKLPHFIFFLFLSFQLQAHNPNVVALNIEYEDGSWIGKISFSTFGLQQLLTKELAQDSYEITDTDSCRLTIQTFISKHVQLKINQFVAIELTDMVVSIGNHVTECTFRLKNSPVRAEYWSFSFGYTSLDEHLDHMIQFKVDKRRSKFMLDGSAEGNFRKDAIGNFQKVTSK